MTTTPRADGGSGTIWMLTLCALLWFTAFAVVMAAGARADRQRAATAADLTALAGARTAAEGAEHSCGTARETAEANGAHLAACTVTGLTVEVQVSLPSQVLPRQVTARARAGPVDAPDPADPGEAR